MKGTDTRRLETIMGKALAGGGEYRTKKYIYRVKKSIRWTTLYRTPVKGGETWRVYEVFEEQAEH